MKISVLGDMLQWHLKGKYGDVDPATCMYAAKPPPSAQVLECEIFWQFAAGDVKAQSRNSSKYI